MDSLRYFVDEQRFGPYRFWHHKHFFADAGQKTEVRDLVHYALPFDPFGRLAHPLFVRRKLDAIGVNDCGPCLGVEPETGGCKTENTIANAVSDLIFSIAPFHQRVRQYSNLFPSESREFGQQPLDYCPMLNVA